MTNRKAERIRRAMEADMGGTDYYGAAHRKLMRRREIEATIFWTAFFIAWPVFVMVGLWLAR